MKPPGVLDCGLKWRVRYARGGKVARSMNEFSLNERVNHHVYGLGTIRMIDDLHTVIEFDQNGRRKFVTSLLKLEQSDVAAPERKRPRIRKPKARK